MDLLSRVKSLSLQYSGEVVAMRRHLHANPELSYQEHDTARYVAGQLRSYGLEPKEGIATTGVLVEIKGRNPDKRMIDQEYHQPSELVIQLSLRDVVLDFFISRQHLYTNLLSGSSMIVKSDGCCDSSGEYLLKFSQRCRETINDFEQKGYRLKSATVNFIVYWKKDGTELECKVIMPELSFQQTSV